MKEEMKEYSSSSNLVKLKLIINQYTTLQTNLGNIKMIVSKYLNYNVNNKGDLKSNFELDKRLDEITKQFEEVNKTYLEILDNNIYVNEQILESSKLIDETKVNLGSPKRIDDIKYFKTVIEENQKLIELNKEFELIKMYLEILKRSTQKLKEISDILINDIKEQGRKLSPISDNMVYVKRNMESSDREMKKTEESLSNSNYLKLWVILFISIISVVIVLMYLIIYKN